MKKGDEIKTFISSYLIPAYEEIYVDGTMRKEFNIIVDEAEKCYREMEG